MIINKDEYNEQIEVKIKEAVEESIKNTIEEAQFVFAYESEIHGYLRCQLKQFFKKNKQLNDKTDLIIRECNTRLFYHRESGTDNGIEYLSTDYNNLITLGYRPKRGKFDFGIWNPKREYFNEDRKPVQKADIGIEIKRQKKADKKDEFIKDVKKDIKKLTDSENKVKHKYLLIFMFHPNIFKLNLEDDLGEDKSDINIAYCEINMEENTIDVFYSPDNWLFCA